MQRRVEQAIDGWLADGEPNTGGSLWAFPAGRGVQSRTITPADVVAWDQALVNLRNNRRAARPTILPVLEYENLEDPLHPDERTIRIILANESDLLDAKQAAARETDATLYQVEISVAFEPELHRPIRLERIAPSYRYNDYLALRRPASRARRQQRSRDHFSPHLLPTVDQAIRRFVAAGV